MPRNLSGFVATACAVTALAALSSGCAGSSRSPAGTGGVTSENLADTVAAAQRKAGSYAFTLHANGLGRTTATGTADVSTRQPAVSALIDFEGMRVRAVGVDGALFIRKAVPGSAWQRVDPSRATGPGVFYGSPSEPDLQLRVLRRAGTVERVGPRQVGGVRTTEYAVRVPRAAFLYVNPDLVGFANDLPATLEYDVYLDRHHLIRKLANHQQLTYPDTELSTVITFTGYGDDVSIQAPPTV